jgi:hypothetical protein
MLLFRGLRSVGSMLLFWLLALDSFFLTPSAFLPPALARKLAPVHSSARATLRWQKNRRWLE